MADTVLVTGATGFAGGHVLDLLTAEGTDDVVGWHRPGHMPEPHGSIRWMPVDLLNREAVDEAIAHVSPAVVYHCGGAAHVGRAWDRTAATLAVNVRGTHNLLAA